MHSEMYEILQCFVEIVSIVSRVAKLDGLQYVLEVTVLVLQQ